MFIETEWAAAVTALLNAIHGYTSQPMYVRPRRPWRPEDIPELSQQLADGLYNPSDWFVQEKTGAGTVSTLGSVIPQLQADNRYYAVVLNARDEMLLAVSKPFQGILFEDPFYALLASFNIGQTKKLFVLPTVESRDHAWRQRPAILSSLRDRTYRAHLYFSECLPLRPQHGVAFAKLLSIEGDQLIHIIQNGTADIRVDGNGGLFTIFTYVPSREGEAR